MLCPGRTESQILVLHSYLYITCWWNEMIKLSDCPPREYCTCASLSYLLYRFRFIFKSNNRRQYPKYFIFQLTHVTRHCTLTSSAANVPQTVSQLTHKVDMGSEKFPVVSILNWHISSPASYFYPHMCAPLYISSWADSNRSVPKLNLSMLWVSILEVCQESQQLRTICGLTPFTTSTLRSSSLFSSTTSWPVFTYIMSNVFGEAAQTARMMVSLLLVRLWSQKRDIQE